MFPLSHAQRCYDHHPLRTSHNHCPPSPLTHTVSRLLSVRSFGCKILNLQTAPPSPSTEMWLIARGTYCKRETTRALDSFIFACSCVTPRYYWELGGASYIGGELYYKSSNSDTLVYNSGRDISRGRKPVDSDGNDAWLTFTNTKLFLVSTGATDWNVRRSLRHRFWSPVLFSGPLIFFCFFFSSEWRGIEMYDFTERSFNVFGDVWLDQVWHIDSNLLRKIFLRALATQRILIV